jgi:fucose permease
MTAAADAGTSSLRRDAATWYAYLLLAYYTYVTSIQGNIIPSLKAELHLTYAEVSLHPSALALGFIVAGIFGEMAVARFGRSRVMVAGAYGSAAGMLLLSLAPAAWASIGACLVTGGFGAFIPATVSAILSDLHGPRRGIAYAEANALCYVFAIMAPVIIGVAAALGVNWRVGLFTGALAAVLIVRSYRGVRLPEQPRRVATDASVRLPPAFWAYWAMLAFGVALEFSALLWAPAYFGKVVGLSPAAAAIAAGVFFAAMLVSRTVLVRLVAMFSGRRVFVAAAAVVIVGFLAYWGGTSSAPLAILGLFVIGLGTGPFYVLGTDFCMQAAGAASARGSARIVTAPGVSILLNPLLLGAIADRAGLHAAQVMLPVFVLASVASFAVGTLLQRRGGLARV